MSTTVPDDVLIPRDAALAELKAALSSVQGAEDERRKKSAFHALAPWAFSGMLGVLLCAYMAKDYVRPPPRDHFTIAVMRADNTYDTVDRDELPPTRAKVLRDYSAIKFVTAWEGYTWRANQSNYNLVSAVTVGENLRKIYQKRFQPGAVGNVDDMYGPDVTRDVPLIDVIPIADAPFALDVRMIVRLKKPTGTTCQQWSARLQFKEDTDHVIPPSIQKVFDPMDIIFVSYDSHVDPTAPGITPCAS